MKRNYIGAAVLLFATIGAFAAAKNTTLDMVWYESEDGCVQVEATKCATTGTPNCVEPLFDVSTGLPLGISAQIFEQRDPLTLECITPYHRP